MKILMVTGLAMALFSSTTDEHGCGANNTKTMADIEADAVKFGSNMDGKPPRAVQCMDVDSDNDGYVTCTVFRVDRDPYAIECAIRKDWHGCKPKVPKVVQSQQ